MEAINRRHFIGGSAASLLGAAALEWPGLPAFAAPVSDAHFAFFDERFEQARLIAAQWPATNGVIAVRGDITPWVDELVRAARTRPLGLRGVSTESFRFCASVLLGEHAVVAQQVSRLDRDLVLWTLRASPRVVVEPYHV